MLAKANRVVSGADFRSIVRTGRRASTPIAVVYSTRTGEQPTRFGFIVAKSVGGSVVRNRMRRQLRSIGRELLAETAKGVDVVVRPLPGSAEHPWATLQSQVIDAVHKSVERHGDVERR
jgi:ribonuclease P protein component